jgi:hypothetical protein
MRLLLLVTMFVALVCPARADDPPNKSDQASAVKFLKAHILGKTFESATAKAKIDSGKLESEYSSRSSYGNLRETKTGFTFAVVEEVRQTNYPIGEDGKRAGPGKDAGRKHTTQYQIIESLSTGELLGVSIIPERTIGADVFPAVISAVKLKQKDGGLVMSSSDVWYHDEFSGTEKGWKPGTAEVAEVFTHNNGKSEVRVKVRLYEFDPKSGEKKLAADVPEQIMSEASNDPKPR